MKAIFCSILTRQSYDFWANGDLRKPYNKPASLSQITSILQLFIKQTSICHDNLLVLQLNIKKGSNNNGCRHYQIQCRKYLFCELRTEKTGNRNREFSRKFRIRVTGKHCCNSCNQKRCISPEPGNQNDLAEQSENSCTDNGTYADSHNIDKTHIIFLKHFLSSSFPLLHILVPNRILSYSAFSGCRLSSCWPHAGYVLPKSLLLYRLPDFLTTVVWNILRLSGINIMATAPNPMRTAAKIMA